MKKLFTLIMMLLLLKTAVAQNLTPNPDFEQYSTCPVNTGEINNATGWYRPTDGSTDYFNSCDATNWVGVPYNFMGYQQAASGNAYTGLFVWSGAGTGNRREYLACQLTSPLVAGQTYQFNMKVNHANYSKYSTDDIQVLFTNNQIIGLPHGLLVPYTPQLILNTGLINDTAGWVPLSGLYTAQGGERYMMIGNFLHDSLTTVFLFNINLSGGNQVYLHVDDVTLSPFTAFHSPDAPESVNVYPNPFFETFHIDLSSSDEAELIVTDLTGRTVLRRLIQGSTTIDPGSVTPGIYNYEIRSGNHVLARSKLIKQNRD